MSPEILELCNKVTRKRPKIVIEHILEHGFVTTEELKSLYGYDHPPRAARDVREEGIPLETFSVTSATTGRQIAAYRFDDPKKIQGGRIGGRVAFPKKLKPALIKKLGSRSTLTGERLAPLYLQIDHRVPYEVAGNSADFSDLDEFMLLDASSQRAKSWACEHCQNFRVIKEPAICAECFWAYPEDYKHVAMVPERRLDLVWREEDTQNYDRLQALADQVGLSLSEYVKQCLEQHLSKL